METRRRCSSCRRMQRLRRSTRAIAARSTRVTGAMRAREHFLVTNGASCDFPERSSIRAAFAHSRRKRLKSLSTKCARPRERRVITRESQLVQCADKCDKCRGTLLDFLQRLLCFPPLAHTTPPRAERVWCRTRDVGCHVCCSCSCAGSVGCAPTPLARH